MDPEGRTELHYAALANDRRNVGTRLAAGDDPDAPDRHGLTPLHMAAQVGAWDAARELLDHGATVDLPNDAGNTPLFVAVFNCRGGGGLIELLRQRGADPLRANDSGQTPLGLARMIANYDVGRFFADLP
jgi:ankyrin repeat protein